MDSYTGGQALRHLLYSQLLLQQLLSDSNRLLSPLRVVAGVPCSTVVDVWIKDFGCCSMRRLHYTATGGVHHLSPMRHIRVHCTAHTAARLSSLCIPPHTPCTSPPHTTSPSPYLCKPYTPHHTPSPFFPVTVPHSHPYQPFLAHAAYTHTTHSQYHHIIFLCTHSHNTANTTHRTPLSLSTICYPRY